MTRGREGFYVSEELLSDVQATLGPDKIMSIIPQANSVFGPDRSEKYSLRTTRGKFFLIRSSEAAPLLVKRGVDRQKEAKACLEGLPGETIELPVYEGFSENRSFAIWVKQRPLYSDSLISKIERRLTVPGVYRWLRAIATKAKSSPDCSQLVTSLEQLRKLDKLSQEIKHAADEACRAVRVGAIQSLEVVQHSDLWIGNILKAPTKTGFIVIDWEGAIIDGAPFYDLVSFCVSEGASLQRFRREVAAHIHLLGCEPGHSLAYLLSGFGKLHMGLEYLPENRLVEMCERNFYALQSALPT